MMAAHKADAALLAQAADWLVLLQSGEASEHERCAFESWRQRSPQHAAAWQRAEQVLNTFGRVPATLGRQTLQQLPSPRRRQLLQALGVGAVVVPGAWMITQALPWRSWTADLRTATGEQRSVQLPDGSRLLLNTASAVDIVFSAGERRLRLQAGEILVTTAPDPAPHYRPFIVETPQGTVRALGTRFSVRRFDDATQVAVFEHAIEIRLSGRRAHTVTRLAAGQQARFGSDAIDPPQAVDAAAAAWERGMLLARGLRLSELAAELSRYRSGFIRCSPAVADLRVSGAFPIRDTDASLRLLEQTLPLQLGRRSRYWITLEPRGT